MALEYEVRSEYRNLPLEKLLEQPVDIFEGVGDTQAAFLKQYFGITTVRQLGNFPFFLWALGIQELALKGGEDAGKSVEELSKAQQLKFSIRPSEKGKTARQLLMGPMSALDGLTPAQNLALYDAFRLTNIIQLAHNRIMLEARIIEYLEKHNGIVDETATREQIASILGADTVIPLTGEEAQLALSGGKHDDDSIHKMTTELDQHLRGRIDALRERASERIREMDARSTTTSNTEGVGMRQEVHVSGDRMDSLRSIRERTETTRIQALGSRAEAQSAADRVAALEASRMAASTASQSAAADVPPPTGMEDEVMSPPDQMEGIGSEGSDTLSTDPGMTIHTHDGLGTEGEEEPTFGEAGTLDDVSEGAAEQEEEKAFRPWMAIAAVVLIILVVAIWMMSGGDDKEEMMAGQESTDSMATTGEATTATEGTAQDAGPTTQVGQTTDTSASEQTTVGGQTTTVAGQATTGANNTTVAPAGITHTVSKGESLWRISRRYYDRGALWPTIHEANRDQIKNPNLIYPRQEFTIPEKD